MQVVLQSVSFSRASSRRSLQEVLVVLGRYRFTGKLVAGKEGTGNRHMRQE